MAENTAPAGSGSMTVDQAAASILGMMDAPQESEDQPEQPEAEESPEVEAQEDSEEAQEEAQPQRFRVKAAGEERDVSLDELIDGYQKGLDYTKKSQTLAEQRKTLESERVALDQAKQARDAYAQRLQLIDNFLKQQNKQENLEELKETDPIGYAVKVAERTEREKQQAMIQAEQQRLAQQQDAERQAYLAKHVQAESQRLADLIPGYADPNKGTEVKQNLRKFAETVGFSAQELSQAYDSRMVHVLWMASQYAKLQSNKPEVSKKVQEAPKMLRPGVAASQKNVADETTKKVHAQLRKTGKVSDAAALFERLL